MPEPSHDTDRNHRLERVIRQLREREAELRSRLARAHRQLQNVGEQMEEAFVQIDARTEAVVAGAEFRALAWHELDIEGAIALTIDHLAARFGACNVAFWLSSSKGEFAIAGYGFYDVPRALAEATLGLVADEVCPILGPECIAHDFEDGSQLLTAPPPGDGVLRGRRVLICPTVSRGEVLGAVMLFRSADKQWPENATDTLAAVGEACGEQLARIIRVSNRGRDRWPSMDTD